MLKDWNSCTWPLLNTDGIWRIKVNFCELNQVSVPNVDAISDIVFDLFCFCLVFN